MTAFGCLITSLMVDICLLDYWCKCRRPTAVQDRPVDSDEDDFRDRDYDISTMASNLNREVYRYGMFDNEDAEEVCPFPK